MHPSSAIRLSYVQCLMHVCSAIHDTTKHQPLHIGIHDTTNKTREWSGRPECLHAPQLPFSRFVRLVSTRLNRLDCPWLKAPHHTVDLSAHQTSIVPHIGVRSSTCVEQTPGLLFTAIRKHKTVVPLCVHLAPSFRFCPHPQPSPGPRLHTSFQYKSGPPSRHHGQTCSNDWRLRVLNQASRHD